MDDPQVLNRARQGDSEAQAALLEPWRGPLFGYIYRLITLRQDAEDLLQDVLVRALESLPSFRGEARFKTWLFGIATHVCLDYLRSKHRWRVDAQLLAEQETVAGLMSAPDFVYEIREHVAFCFSCIARTLDPEEQAAILLREVLGFSNQEAAAIINLSEPVFRHRLSAARATMIQAYDGLCQLLNKTGACYQYRSLREFAPEANNLFDARLAIVREAPLENGRSRVLHDAFYQGINAQEEAPGSAGS